MTPLFLAGLLHFVPGVAHLEVPATVVIASNNLMSDFFNTLSCEVRVEDGDVEIQETVTAKYYRSRSFAHVRERNLDGVVTDFLARDSVITQLERGIREINAGRRSASDALCTCDVWSMMLLKFPGRGVSEMQLESLLKISSRQLEWSTITDGGRECARLQLEFEDPDQKSKHLDIRFDPRFNYLARHIIVTPAGSTEYHGDREVLEFTEISPGIYFPTKCRNRAVLREKTLSARTVTVTNIKLNEPLPDDIGQIRIPEGAMMSDRLRRVSYRVGRDGGPIGKVESMDINPVIVQPSRETGQIAQRQSQIDSVSPWRWLMVGSGACFISCLVMLVRQRYRNRAMR